MSSTSQNIATPAQNGKCINQGRPVYFSYARNSTKKPGWEHISDCVDAILKEFEAQNIEYRLDKRDIGAGDRISDFEREIGWNSEVVVLVFSDKYFRSMHCMYELVQIKKALKKYPNKRLLCVKSGNFDLSDSNYIYDLERFWGDIKQDYEMVERHRSREHSGIEKAAFENGFYFDEILGLYPFFSALNYSYATNTDWSSFVGDIKKYYIDTPKSLFADERKRKSLLRNLKFYGLGIITLAVIIGLLFFKFGGNVSRIDDVAVSFPEYSSNVYLNDGLAYIKAIRLEEDRCVIDFRTINISDDTLKQVPAAHSPSAHIVADGVNYNLIKAYSIAEGVNNLESGRLRKVPEVFPGGKGTKVDFCMEFEAIPFSTENIDFVEQSNLGVFGLKLQRKTLKDGLTKPVSDTLKSFGVFAVEITTDETIVCCGFCNRSENDVSLSASYTDCYLMVDGKQLNLKNAAGIPMAPNAVNIAKDVRTEFALFFPPIDKKTATIGLKFNDQLGFDTIKLH
ncbi:MAG: toll/interleukin-1 receptor domain-containing protein [Bacteroidales bacterium]|nr:toll/interleukin-1 receptor domain-containing protein [Bacteroidales bacterium]